VRRIDYNGNILEFAGYFSSNKLSESLKGTVRMRIIRGLLFTGIAALLVGYGINRNILNEKFPFLEQAVQTNVAEKIQVLTSPIRKASGKNTPMPFFALLYYYF
jgi:hypothetical protein